LKDFDLTYISIDSISEGVGSSQILTLIEELAKFKMSISLITLEKKDTPLEIVRRLEVAKVNWIRLEFGRPGIIGGFLRLFRLIRVIPASQVIHGRSDIPTLAGILSMKGPVLWDVRSLWGQQRSLIRVRRFNPIITFLLEKIENFNARNSAAMSTLTQEVVPYLAKRHLKIPEIRCVVPTCVDLEKFSYKPLPKDGLHLLLSGSFNDYYDLDLMRQVILGFRRKQSLRVTWARDSASSAKVLGVGEDQIMSVLHSEMPNLVEKSHFGLVLCRTNSGPSLLAAMPTKAAEFWATGRPLLMTSGIGDLGFMCKEFKAGVVIEDGISIDQALDQLLLILLDPETPDRCRGLAIKYFDMQRAAKTYFEAYQQIKELD
jgi:hypothetical protein